MTQDADTLVQQKEIGLRLKATRVALGLTQEQIAQSVNVERTRWTNWEKGTRPPDMWAMMRLADRWGATLDWVYRGDMSGLQHSLAIKIKPPESKSFRLGA